MSVYRLRVLQSSWGLWVDLGLSSCFVDGDPGDGRPVAERVWMTVAPEVFLWEEGANSIADGIRRIARQLMAKAPSSQSALVIRVESLEFPWVDFQDDALEAAVVGWAAELLGIEDDPAVFSFDKAHNRYVIEYDDEVWSQEPPLSD